MAKIRICKDENCKNAATTEGYCRLHYLRNWRRIKEEAGKKSAKKLNRYIEYVIKKHPDRYLDIIKKDLRSPTFNRDIEERFGYDDEEADEILGEPAYEEEIERLIKQLKVEKGF